MTRFYWAGSILLVASAAGAAAWLSPQLPDQIPTHWNIRNEVDGYGGKWTLFLMPIVMVGVLLLSTSCRPFAQVVRGRFVPADVSLYHDAGRGALCVHPGGAALHRAAKCIEGAARAAGADIHRGDVPLFWFDGERDRQGAQNFYIGIRVPWTLASDRVWNDTHRMAGWLWVGAGIVGFCLTVLGRAMYVAIVLLISGLVTDCVFVLPLRSPRA